MREYRYFEAAGKSLEVCQQIAAEREKAYEETRALMKELGATNAIGAPRIRGLKFPEGKAPDGWRSYAKGHRDYLLPSKQRKDLALLRERITTIHLPGAENLSSRLGIPWCITNETGHNGGSVILFVTYETIGDKIILVVPVDHKGEFGTPPDARPIKTSEYWLLKEAAAEDPHGEEALKLT